MKIEKQPREITKLFLPREITKLFLPRLNFFREKMAELGEITNVAKKSFEKWPH